MDTSLAPKLLAAALVGASVTSLRAGQEPTRQGVMIKLEWVQTGNAKRTENVSLRAPLDHATTLRQPNRTIEVKPSLREGSSYCVDLKLSTVNERGVPEMLDTQVNLAQGETVVVMGTSMRDGKATAERLLFLTAHAL